MTLADWQVLPPTGPPMNPDIPVSIITNPNPLARFSSPIILITTMGNNTINTAEKHKIYYTT